jgi:hypothetical protein
MATSPIIVPEPSSVDGTSKLERTKDHTGNALEMACVGQGDLKQRWVSGTVMKISYLGLHQGPKGRSELPRHPHAAGKGSHDVEAAIAVPIALSSSSNIQGEYSGSMPLDLKDYVKTA